jgi:hypothetical protein
MQRKTELKVIAITLIYSKACDYTMLKHFLLNPFTGSAGTILGFAKTISFYILTHSNSSLSKIPEP